MTTRTIAETVTFRHPFRLSGADEAQPAGRYLVETDEELLEGPSFPAYRRLATSIHLAGRPHSSELARVVDIAPAELAAALATDAAAREPGSTPINRIAGGTRERRRSAAEFVFAGCKRWLAFNATEVKLTILIVGGVALTGLLA